MTSGMDKYWIILKVGDKELPRVGHQLVSCSLFNFYVLKKENNYAEKVTSDNLIFVDRHHIDNCQCIDP